VNDEGRVQRGARGKAAPEAEEGEAAGLGRVERDQARGMVREVAREVGEQHQPEASRRPASSKLHGGRSRCHETFNRPAWACAASSFSEGLAPEKLDALARQCVWRNYEAGKRIISRNADDRDVYLLVSGRVRITPTRRAAQVTFRDIPAGEVFGEVAALDEKPRSADVIALDNALLASMAPPVFRRLLADEPLVGGRVMTRLAALVRSLSDRVIDLSTLGVQNRIHAEILRLARAAGVARNRARLEPGPKHADIASSGEHLSASR
jgi:CRP-like cAMP-binding protein